MTVAVSATRERLLDVAEQLFARNGYQGVTTREITEAAEQRNTSAVTYHFGSRQGLLLAILARRGGPIDRERGLMRSQAGENPRTRDLVAALVVPYANRLHTDEGRSYLRIVAQMRGRFAAWRVESDASTTVHLAAILDEIEDRQEGSAAVGRERVLGLIILLSGKVAERARNLDDPAGMEDEALDHDQFVENLIEMCTAVVGGRPATRPG